MRYQGSLGHPDFQPFPPFLNHQRNFGPLPVQTCTFFEPPDVISLVIVLPFPGLFLSFSHQSTPLTKCFSGSRVSLASRTYPPQVFSLHSLQSSVVFFFSAALFTPFFSLRCFLSFLLTMAPAPLLNSACRGCCVPSYWCLVRDAEIPLSSHLRWWFSL